MLPDAVTSWLGQHESISQALMAVGVILLSYASYFITRKYILRALSRLVKMTSSKMDDLLLNDVVIRRISVIVPFLIIYGTAHLFPVAEVGITRVAAAIISLFVLLLIGALLSAFNDVYITLEVSQGRPIKSYLQIIKLIIYMVGAIIIISNLLGRSPLVMLSGFGALTAVILLIFRDTILSFVASLQITSNDLVREGDWIEVPKYGADGDVVDIALHTVKIQNWDKTFTVIPTHKLIEDTFKNWRGMEKSGGRRIKRAINIDLGSIRFCDEPMVQRFKEYRLIKEYVEKKQEELVLHNREHGIDDDVLVNGRRMTNIGTFRAYVEAYLRNHPKIHQRMTFLVRQLPPGPQGLPLEIYVFTNDTAWANYEAIQSDIFDHILAVAPQFGLKVFQHPTGSDFGRLAEDIQQGNKSVPSDI